MISLDVVLARYGEITLKDCLRDGKRSQIGQLLHSHEISKRLAGSVPCDNFDEDDALRVMYPGQVIDYVVEAMEKGD